MKQKIIKVLSTHPNGLKAKDIASFISGADRKDVNQVLYANPTLFSINDNYEWKLKILTIQSREKKVKSENKLQSLGKYCDLKTLPEKIKNQINNLSDNEYDKFVKRLDELYSDSNIPTPTGLYWLEGERRIFFVSLALSSDSKISMVKMRSQKMRDLQKDSSTYFDEWKKIINKTAKEFEQFLKCAKVLSEQRLRVDWIFYRQWFEIVNKLSKYENAEEFIKNNKYINENISWGTWQNWSYENWFCMVFLQEEELQDFALKFKKFKKVFSEHEHVLRKLKKDEIFKICTKNDSEFRTTLDLLVKISGIIRLQICPEGISVLDYIKDEKRIEKDYAIYAEEQKKIDRINAISGSYVEPIYRWGIFEEKEEKKEIRYCTSDCSTCNRESCPYDKR